MFADASNQSAHALVDMLNAGGSTDAVPSLLMPDDETCAAKPPSLATRVVVPNSSTFTPHP